MVDYTVSRNLQLKGVTQGQSCYFSLHAAVLQAAVAPLALAWVPGHHWPLRMPQAMVLPAIITAAIHMCGAGGAFVSTAQWQLPRATLFSCIQMHYG